ncbi:hypothetical protein BO94DRAFT_513295 [Aspergillus sclerotioniger CBS 115572]|uniref:Rhodopsin domain-containing protein n=1 Tax=Aspergillus sclerotioniger CBS 115572 TaxID=1450535 RepID=A0A317WY34_9EURO|nr:hypothetical protein BO94DRAFT_513295 [Aspergillus sclerotioniger CBS 115572]PWY91336.1 hypothetical protein BO94DRAFT_513295 [Aspergillus sclerotioniger CBS 115572]
MPHHWPLPNPPTQTALLIVTSIFCLTSLTSVTLRFYARRLARLDLLADDWFALAALILTLAFNAILLAGTFRNIITNYTQTTPTAKKYHFALHLTEILALGLIKLCFFSLWNRVFITHPIHHLCSFLIVVITLWTVAFILATIFQCGTHWNLIWSVDTTSTCTTNPIRSTVYTITDLITNILITIIPIPVIWGLNMWPVKKIGMLGLYVVGIYLTAASIARTYVSLVIAYTEERRMYMEDFSLLGLWAAVEVNVGLVVCCVTVVMRGVREVWADKRKKEFHMLSGVGVGVKNYAGAMGRERDKVDSDEG